MKRAVLAILAMLSLMGPMFGPVAESAGAAQRCLNVEKDLEERNLPTWFSEVSWREARCMFDAHNTRGENSIGYVQLNMHSGFFQQHGITAEWLMASEDNYWDGVVMLYRYCGKRPWFPRKVNGQNLYWPCLKPEQPTYTSVDLFLIAMANANQPLAIAS